MFVLALRGVSTDLLHHVTSKQVHFISWYFEKTNIVLYYVTLLSTAFILMARRFHNRIHWSKPGLTRKLIRCKLF